MRSVERVGIVADDLTSAGDGSAPFRAEGRPARVLSGIPVRPPEPGVTAIDTDSRALPEPLAARRVSEASRALAGVEILVKTIDSTLRGHLATELRAALAASGRRTAVIAPAFPGAGRATRGGVQLLGDRPVHRTAFARDPVHPVRSSDLLRLLPRTAHVRIGQAAKVAELAGAGVPCVADAMSDVDLDAVVAAVPVPHDVLWVGSPGLAAALARAVGPASTPFASPPTPAGPALVVIGSMHPASLRQLDILRSAGIPTVCATDTNASVRAARAMSDTGSLVVHGPSTLVAASAAVPRSLATIATELADVYKVLILTGGATARAVLSALEVPQLDLIDEPEPGVALATASQPRRLTVILKAGGFGSPDALLRLRALLTNTPTT